MKHFLRNLFGDTSMAGGHSIQGRKAEQQDAWYISGQTSNGRLVLVADGVGGHAHGEFASQLCVEMFREEFEKQEAKLDIPQYFLQHTKKVAEAVWQKSQSDPNYRNCGTTLSAFIVFDGKYYLVQIGDSRIYLLDSSDNLHQLTQDQTVVQQLLDQGEIQLSDVTSHPQKNVMYSAIGQEPSSIRIDIHGPDPIRKGEILLACSDGIHDALSDQKIRALLIAHKDDEDLAKILVEAAYEAGGKDNITACWFRQ